MGSCSGGDVVSDPISLRDDDGSQWFRQSDGTYRLRKGSGQWSDSYQGYTLQQITETFGIRSKVFEGLNGPDQEYRYLRNR